MSCYIQAQNDLSLQADFDNFLFSGAFSSFSNPSWPNNITSSQSLKLPFTSSSDLQSPHTIQTTSRPVHGDAVVNENAVEFQNPSFHCSHTLQPPEAQVSVTYEELLEVLSWTTPAPSTPTRTPGLTSDHLNQNHHRTPLQSLHTNRNLGGQSVIQKSEPAKFKPGGLGKARSNSVKKCQSAKSLFQSPDLKLFKCELDPKCDKKFARAEHLARHERKHTKEKPFICHCSKSFSRLDNWRQHKLSLHKDEGEENERTERRLVEVHRAISLQTHARQPTSLTKFTSPPNPATVMRVSPSLLDPHGSVPKPSSLSSSTSLEDVDLLTIFSGCGHRAEPEMSLSVFTEPSGSGIANHQLPESLYPELLDISRRISYPSQSTTAYATRGGVPPSTISLGLLEPFSLPSTSWQQPLGSYTYENSSSHTSNDPPSMQMTSYGAPVCFEADQYHHLAPQEVTFSRMTRFAEPSIEDPDFLSFLNQFMTPRG